MELSTLKKLAHELICQASRGESLIVYGSLSSPSLWVIKQFEKIEGEEFLSIVFDQRPLANPLVGFLNYENLRDGNLSDSCVFKILEGYEFNFSTCTLKSLTDAGDVPGLLKTVLEDSSGGVETEITPDSLSRQEVVLTNFELEASESDEEYLSSVKRVIQQIKEGRFYQMNLLRRFRIKNATRENMLHQWLKHAGSHGAMMILEDQEIFSFSPEHFVTVSPADHGFSIRTSPIKGTIERGMDISQDDANKQKLNSSQKDRAELSMIVDLMRNDLRKVAKPLSVKVLDPGSIKTFSTLHHLVANVEAQALDRLKMSDLVQALFPAGSITGAPKIEVMKAIEEFEHCPRNFFMGSAFKMETTKHLESTVMIRTVLKRSEEYLYAAGSGIVIKSQPENELSEIEVKCRVLTGAFQ